MRCRVIAYRNRIEGLHATHWTQSSGLRILRGERPSRRWTKPVKGWTCASGNSCGSLRLICTTNGQVLAFWGAWGAPCRDRCRFQQQCRQPAVGAARPHPRAVATANDSFEGKRHEATDRTASSSRAWPMRTAVRAARGGAWRAPGRQRGRRRHLAHHAGRQCHAGGPAADLARRLLQADVHPLQRRRLGQHPHRRGCRGQPERECQHLRARRGLRFRVDRPRWRPLRRRRVPALHLAVHLRQLRRHWAASASTAA